jgi:flagellar hook-length control protein FliK
MPALTISPPTVRPGDAHKSSAPPPGASPGDFAALLDTTSARTAPAEGPKTRPSRSETQRRDDRDDARQDEADRAGSASPDPSTARAEAAAAADTAGERRPDAAAQDGDQPRGDQPPAGDAPEADAVQPVAAPGAPVDAAALAAAGPAFPATAAAARLPGTPGAPGTPGVPPPPTDPAPVAVDPNAQPAGDGKLQLPVELLGARTGAKGGHGHGDPAGGQPPRSLSAAASPVPAATAPTTAAAAAPGAGSSATDAGGMGAGSAPATAAPAPAVPTVVAAGQPAATPTTAVPTANGTPQLTRASVTAAAERVQDLVRIATMRSGNARATLQLKPVELGTVDVHLRTTRDGLVATIAAHSQSSLDALQSAGADLRRQLEDRGVQLHSLDLQLGAGENGFTNPGDARQASSGGRGGARGWDLGGEDDAAGELTITTVSRTPAGELVDVTA